MTDLRTAAQQALEALEKHSMQRSYEGGVVISNAAIALRAALAQQEQEPYGYVYEYDSIFGLHRKFYPGPDNGKQKPDRIIPVYIHSPRREWQGLTDQQQAELRTEIAELRTEIVRMAQEAARSKHE